MGEAFLTRRSSTTKEQKITFNDTPMVATKTLPNALSLGRFSMAVASDNEYIAFLCGLNGYGSPVSDLDIFDRGGNHWHSYWSDELTDMAAVISNNWLIGIGGRYSDGTGTKITKKWRMNHAIRDYDVPVSMTDITRYDPLYAACAAPFDDGIAVFGGLIASGAAYDNVWKYSYLNKKGSDNDAGYVDVGNVTNARGFAAMGKITSTAVLLCGGVDRAKNTVYDTVDILGRNVKGVLNVGSRGSLSVAQYKATQANIYSQGRTYLLVGLGLTLPQTQGSLVVPERVVPNIDVYASDISDSVTQVEGGKNSTFTLPLEGTPVSAVALPFGDCVLYVVGYRDGVTKNKGYLVQLNPLRITSMEFGFSRTYTQGGVIGNDVGFLAGGTKNGQVSTDVEVIQLLRNVPIYPGMKYKVGSMASEATADSFTLHPLNNEIKLSGYMKL